jgi:hypothetical protein
MLNYQRVATFNRGKFENPPNLLRSFSQRHLHGSLDYQLLRYTKNIHCIPIFPNFDSMFPYFPYIPLYSVIFHYIPLYSIIFHYIPLYSVIFHYIPLYSIYPMKSPFTVSRSVTSHSYDERFGSPPFPTGTWSIASRQVTLHNWSARGARKAGAFLGAWSWGTMDWIEIYIILYTVYIYITIYNYIIYI